MDKSRLIEKLQDTITNLQRRREDGTYDKINEFCGCFLDIQKELQGKKVDYQHVNLKLSAYFANQYLYIFPNELLDIVAWACDHAIKNTELPF